MNMTSRYGLLAGVAGLIWAGCSAPAEDVADAPTLPPPGYANGTLGQAGAGPVASAGTGGTAPVAPPPAAGAAGAAPVAAGGSAGAPVAAGGAGGGAGGAAIPTGSGNVITHDAEGWVAGNTNGLGIQGSFYTISDATNAPPGVTTVTIDDLTTPTTVCTSGIASQVPDDTSYGQFWGGGVAFNLADPGGMAAAPAGWTRNTVTGFSFTLTGPTVPAGEQMRFKATTLEGGVVNDNGYCTTAATGANSVQFGDLVNECWTGGAGAPALGAATQLVSLQWQVATVTASSTPFDFCIENLTALTTP